MARIRTIKPEFWVDEVMVELPAEARLLFIGLWNFVDDEGYIEYKPKRIKMMIFPADDFVIEESLNALCAAGRLHVVGSDQGPLLRVANWGRHQVINRPKKTRFTGIMPQNDDESVSAHGVFSVSSVLNGREGNGREIKELVRSADDRVEQPVDNSVVDAFERAYGEWPKKTNRKQSLAKFKLKARTRGLDRLVADIERFGRAYASSTDKQFVPALNVWLNGERWTDELPTPTTAGVDKAWTAMLREPPLDPCASGHRWVTDGTCANCEARRKQS